MTLFEAAPYQNLILTGPSGVGKTTIGRRVASQLETDFYDLENEILAREGQSADEIRELFGEAWLRALEAEAIHDLSLRRSAVMVVHGPAMLVEGNRARLLESGVILCLTCSLNEILRRQHAARGAWFHDPRNRAALLSRLKREQQVRALDLPQIETTRLSLDEAVAAVVAFWRTRARV